MIKLVAFDNNGTIFDDYDAVIYGSVVLTFEMLGLPPPTKEQHRSEATSDHMKFYHDHGLPPFPGTEEEQRMRDTLRQAVQTYWDENYYKASFRPDVAKTVFELKKMGIRTAIVSAWQRANLIEEIDRFGFWGIFDPIIGGAKDKSVALADLCKNFSIDPAAAIYVDDTVVFISYFVI